MVPPPSPVLTSPSLPLPESFFSRVYTVHCTVIEPAYSYVSMHRLYSHAPSIRSHRDKCMVFPDIQPKRVSEEPVSIYLFRQIQFLPPCIWDLPLMSYRASEWVSNVVHWREVWEVTIMALLADGGCGSEVGGCTSSKYFTPEFVVFFRYSCSPLSSWRRSGPVL